MAHNVEPMDIDNIDSDFDNKENSIHHSNVYPRTPCTEKGYEELDVSELNMKLRYSITPAASPMSKSYTANCVENRNIESADDTFNANLTRSLNSTMCKNDVNKSVKTLPLQSIPTDQFVDSNRNASVLRPLDSTTVDNNVTVTVTHSADIDENISFPSSSSSAAHTPEATTPTKENPRGDGGSPIMRGLKSVLNMFRSSQSPIPPADGTEATRKEVLSPADLAASTPESSLVAQAVLASTPLATHKFKESNVSKRSSPHKESLVFNEDLERELLWKDETTILFSEEKIPIHKLFPQQKSTLKETVGDEKPVQAQENLNTTVEYMDISYNDSIVIRNKNKTITDLQCEGLNESDGEFLDCETTFNTTSEIVEQANKSVNNEIKDNAELVTTSTEETPINDEKSPLQELTENQAQPQLDLPVATNVEDNRKSFIEPESNQIEEKLPENLVIADAKELTENAIIENKTSKGNKENTAQADTKVENTTFESEIRTPLESESLLSKTFEHPFGNEQAIKSDAVASNLTVLLPSSDDVVAFNDNLTNSTFVQQDCPTIDTVFCDTTYNTKENATFLKDEASAEISDSNPTNSCEGESTFVKAIKDSKNSVTIGNEDATFVKEIERKTESSTVNDCTIPIKSENTTYTTMDKNIALPDDGKTNGTDLGDTFIKEIETIPITSENTTYTAMVENIALLDDGKNNPPKLEDTFVKEIETIPSTSENTTYIQMVENTAAPEDDKNNPIRLEDTFVKEIERAPVGNKTFTATVGYDVFANEIEKDTILVETTNTSTPTAGVVFDNSPADIPLPDEDDIENDKSCGTSVLIEENTIPIELDINNTTATKLQNENNTEDMPIIAKSFDINNSINYLNEEKGTFIATNLNETIQLNEVRKSMEKSTNAEIVLESQREERLENTQNKILPQNILMDVNESNIDFTQSEGVQNPLVHKVEEECLDVSMADLSNDVPLNKDVQPIVICQETINTDEMSAFSEVTDSVDKETVISKANETLNLEHSSHVVDVVDVEIKDTNNQAIVTDSNEKHDIVNETIIVPEVTDIKVPESERNDAEVKDVVPVDTIHNEFPKYKLDTDRTDIQIDELHKTNAVADHSNSPKEVNIETVVETVNKKIDMSSTIDVEIIKKEDIIIEDKIILSENNSPFVSVASDFDPISTEPANTDDIQNPFETKSRVVLTPPSSPKIVSKGYNFNFDEIDDPFATKTKIRMSPTPEMSPNATFDKQADPHQKDIDKNRRKSQPVRRRQVVPKNKLNSTFSGPVKGNKNNDKAIDSSTKIMNQDNSSADLTAKSNTEVESMVAESALSANKITEDTELPTTNNANNLNETKDMIHVEPEKSIEIHEESINKNVPEEKSLIDGDKVKASEDITVENQSIVESVTSPTSEGKTTSSSEQSAYYSAGTSSGEGTVEKNVFNLPEIDDINFNPFVTKSKMRQSPPPGLLADAERDPSYHTKPDAILSEVEKLDCPSVEVKESLAVEEKDTGNISNITCSSKTTDEKDITVREIHTEDEDTQEGPFFETDDNDKMSDFDGEDVDMMQFSELPPQNNDENIESGEMFIDAEAFEFLLNQNKSNVVSDSGKESLFLKFDPLFAKRVSSDGVLAALNKVQKRQSTPKKMAPSLQMNTTFEKPIAGPSSMNITRDVESNITTEENTDDLNITVSKPMMVVTPAVNPVVTPRNKITTTPTSSNRRSITFTSPAIAVIDRLLSLSANNSLVGHDTTVNHASREQNEADLALTQLRELLAEKEINVYNLRTESQELKDRLLSLESQMKTLETESENRLRKINELNEKLSEKTKLNKSMAAVVEEYERTIASLIAETEQDKRRHNEERIQLIKERDEQTAHLASMEVSFSDLHSKYEKSKQIILTCKANEDSYKKSIKEFEENLTKMQSNYELLKQHATSKLNHANQELEKMNRTHESEILKMNAMIKRKELHITSLEETLAQKTKANEELTAICDELINKVG